MANQNRLEGQIFEKSSLRAKIWTFFNDLPKYRHFRYCRRAAFESFEGLGLAMTALNDKSVCM
jgi:hypothetical protein